MVQKQTYQEDDGNVQSERNEGVQNEHDVSNLLNIAPSHVGHLNEQAHNSVHDSASGCEVVERDKRVHLELGGREKLLDHNETSGLEGDTSKLEKETGHDELDLAVGGDDHTENDERDVSESLEVERGDAHGPGCEKDSDGGGSLQRMLV